GDDLLQFARLVHLHHDVGATDELAAHVELRDGRPLAVVLDALANAVVFQHVHGLECLGVDTTGLEDLHGTARKAAHGKARAAFHEEHDVVGLDQLVDLAVNVAHVGNLGASGEQRGLPVVPARQAHYRPSGHWPPLQRSMPARSVWLLTWSNPALPSRARTRGAWSWPCSSSSHPPGRSARVDWAMMVRMSSRPSGPLTSAEPGSWASAGRWGSASAMYGGLLTISAKVCPGTASSQ